MNKPQTPMAMLKGHFANFEDNVAHLIDTKALARVELNKSQPHYSPFGDNSRGVASDFIRIYQDKTNVVGKKKINNDFGYKRNEYNSFAFVFNYMEVEEPYIIVTLKTDGKDYLSSANYSVEEIKNLMKALNKKLKTKEIEIKHPTQLLKIIQDFFIVDDGVDEDKLVEDAVSSINTAFKDLNENLEKQRRSFNSAKVIYSNTVSKYESELKNSDEYKEVQELKKLLLKAETKLSKKDRDLKVEYSIEPKKSSLKSEKSALDVLERDKGTKLTKIIKQYPFHLRQYILDNIN